MKVSRSPILPFFPPTARIETTESCCSAVVEDATLDHRADHHSFAVNTLAWAIQNQLSTKCIERYINKFPQFLVTPIIRLGVFTAFGVPSCPILFYAIEQNSPELIRLLCKAGASVEQSATPSGLPPLAYAVLSAEYNLVDTTDVLITLLAVGADPKDIPEDMWQAPLKSPVKETQGTYRSSTSRHHLPSTYADVTSPLVACLANLLPFSSWRKKFKAMVH